MVIWGEFSVGDQPCATFIVLPSRLVRNFARTHLKREMGDRFIGHVNQELLQPAVAEVSRAAAGRVPHIGAAIGSVSCNLITVLLRDILSHCGCLFIPTQQ
uniref:Uncharacterized protein n=1 Tax=Schistocephalus solidus TaxID=70667 RepID=A0A0X3NIN6_SCHSO